MSSDFFCKPEQSRPFGTSYERKGDKSSLKEERNIGEHGKWFAMVLGKTFPDMNNEASRVVLGNIFAIVSKSFGRKWEKKTRGNECSYFRK